MRNTIFVLLTATVSLPGAIPIDEPRHIDEQAETFKQHLDRGQELLRKREYDNAILELSEAIRLDPTSRLAYCTRAQVRMEMEQYEKAVEDYNAAIQIDPGYAPAYINRANVWGKKNQTLAAIADFNHAIQLDPSNAIAFKNLSWILSSCQERGFRDGKSAIEAASRACELTDRKDPTALDALAAAYAEAGDFDAAAKAQAEAIELTKDYKTRLASYQNKGGYSSVVTRTTEMRRPPTSETTPRADAAFQCFKVPYDATVFVSCTGGGAGAVSEFGIGTSEADHRPLIQGLPSNPNPQDLVKVGFFKAGEELHFYVKTNWSGDQWAFSHDTKSEAANVAFQDQDNSLGLGGSIFEKTGPWKWIMHLDDAGSFEIDDNDEDVLIEIRLLPAGENQGR